MTDRLLLYLIRHGETAWSISGQHTGKTDIPLTAQGRDDARALAPILAAVQFSAVLTSPRRRARETCDLAGLGASAKIEPDLAEWDCGDYEGRRSRDIRTERPGWNLFIDGCPNGETPEQASERADRLIARLRTLTGDVALFSHGHFGAVLAVRWIGLPIANGQNFPLAAGSLSVLGYAADHPDIPVLALWNSAAAAERDQRPRL